MKGIKTLIVALSACVILTGCNWSNMAKGGVIGGAAGGAAGTGVGALIGYLAGGSHGAKLGAAIGAGVGVAGGTTAGLLIGKKMDKAKAAAEALAQAEAIKNENGETVGVKVTFESGILFATGKDALSANAKTSLTKFAKEVVTPDMDLAVVGHTDNTPFKGATAEQSMQKNQTLSEQRAAAVSTYLQSQGVAADQLKSVTGKGQTDPVADNATAAGKEQNRRVEVYIVPSQAMVEAAKAGTLK